MILGFTGTREGMRLKQFGVVRQLVRTTLGLAELHHGDCLGADAEIHKIVRKHLQGVKIIGHPPTDDAFRAFCDFDEERAPLGYIARDRFIVRETELLLAAPHGFTEETRGSGTWATIRFARLIERPVCLVWPDGKISWERTPTRAVK